ncbi:MAG: hypothetical protein V3S08_10995 [Phycisphaerales bacterium]
MTGGRAKAVVVVLGCVAFTCAAVGCETYRVEYHRRPAFYKSAAVGQLEDRVTLEDGTVLVYSTRGESQVSGDRVSGERFQIREELDDGTIILRAMLPQHVLANTMTCLRNQEYQLIWDQLLSKQTKHSYELHDQGYDQFAAFFAANRLELGATLTRMMLGLSRGESFMENLGGGVILYRFHPRIAAEFDFKTVKVIAEDGGLKLLIIE